MQSYSNFFFILLTIWITNVFSDEFHNSQETESVKKSSSHGPAGMMSDHMHVKNEWMVGYRYEYSSYGTLAQGSKKLSRQEVLNMGYGMVATSMTMEMHMLDIMYAPTDDFTLMLMPHYMIMDMGMFGMHGSMNHKVKGMGDTKFGALVRIDSHEKWSDHMSIMLSLPTGSINKRNSRGILTHYDMQLGSGTYDIEPAYTAGFSINNWGFGGQLGGVFRLESSNANGYRLGNKVWLELWSSYDITNYLSVNSRIKYLYQQAIRGEYNKAHTNMSPPDSPSNYGGKLAEWGVGTNWVIPTHSVFGALRFGLEWAFPIYQSVKGIQLLKESMVNFNVSVLL